MENAYFAKRKGFVRCRDFVKCVVGFAYFSLEAFGILGI